MTSELQTAGHGFTGYSTSCVKPHQANVRE